MYSVSEIEKEIERQVVRDLGHKDIRVLQSMFVAGLAEEAGEVAGLHKRVLRDHVDKNDRERSRREAWIDELGDVLWYLTALAIVKGITLEEIWSHNIAKLKERYDER